ncbi:subclass B3 metallo-beta-lactamase [Novosphingobium sp.]|uniref:subclass B3 metallo-beta-lactamase n=1 Tax=Novosphingobium sp. TaxID=1874826 RepID=UPI0025D97761|nr:subclass B3 metallo-beta-lactamase [Novosphingobium sp.]
MKIAFAASLLVAFGVAGPATAAPAAWTQPMAPFQVIDNVYYVGSAGIAAWIIKTPAGLILLDAGMPEYVPTVEANIRTLGFKLSDVKILLNSHAHFDHSGGLARIKADTGAKLIASEGDRLALERGVYPGWEQDHSLDAPPVKVDRVVADGGTVALGGVKLTAMITPGHSAGCTNYLLTVRDQGAAHTVFFFCSASVAANRLVPNPQYPGIVADYRRTFARLKTVRADVFLAPHAEFYDLAGKRGRLRNPGPNPFIVPGEMQKLVAAMEQGFVKALAEQTTRSNTPKH